MTYNLHRETDIVYGEGLPSFAFGLPESFLEGSINAAVSAAPETQAAAISTKLVWCDKASVMGSAAVTPDAAPRNSRIISFLLIP